MEKRSPQQSERTSLTGGILITLAGFVLLKALFIFINAPNVWALNLLHYLPLWTGILLALIPIAGILAWKFFPA